MIKYTDVKSTLFCTQNYCPVHKIYTGTPTVSAKCLLLTSYFPTVCGRTQQNITDNLLRHSNLLWLLINPEFGHEFSLCPVRTKRWALQVWCLQSKCGERLCASKKFCCSPAHISLFYWSKMAHYILIYFLFNWLLMLCWPKKCGKNPGDVRFIVAAEVSRWTSYEDMRMTYWEHGEQSTPTHSLST